MRTLFPILALLLAATPAWAQQRVLTLSEALRTATERQPQLRQAQANTAAANARVDQNFSSLLPQVNASVTYQRSLRDNGDLSTPTPSGVISRQGLNVGASVNQLLWDFGRTTGRWHSAQQSAQAQESSEDQTLLNVLANVQTAYFNALAQQSLVQVAQETLENEQAHLAQAQAQVQVGTRPEIDLLQQRTAVANAQVQLIQARNNAATSRAQLNQAMGVEGTTQYTVREEGVALVEGEDQSVDTLVDVAFQGRPDLSASEHQLRAQELQLSATRANYLPSLSASLLATDSGPNPANLDWGVSGQVGLSWPLFQGGLTRAQVREQQANLSNVQAQRDALHQQVRLEVERAQLAVTAARESLSASEEAQANARERLRLAEGRYRAGVGNIIELSDAQLSATNAAVQRVQATYNLATARTELARALGRRVGGATS
jgi:outer membrane protein